MPRDRLELLAEAHRRKKRFASMAEEDYIEVIYELEKSHGYAQPTDIARILGVTPASVTNMLKRLEEKGLVEYRRYRNPKLTRRGEELASRISRRHGMLLELFLALGVDEERANIEAELAEHFLSDETIEKLYMFLKKCMESRD